MNKKELQSALASSHLHPNKRLGQHFLINDDIAGRIASLDGIGNGVKILEIGPGFGALTAHLIAKGARVAAVEIDAGLCHFLESRYGGSIEIHHADFLKIQLPDDFSVCVSNLPYYCASEILFKLAERYSVPLVYAMVQKEMASRLEALPGSWQYGAMTVSLRLYFDITRLFDIPPKSFYPEPDVYSSFLKLERKHDVPDATIVGAFHKVVKSAFWGRRKPIASALARSPHCPLGKDAAHAICVEAGIDSSARGEELDFDAYLRLARLVAENIK